MIEAPLIIYCDNSGKDANLKEPWSHMKAKHIKCNYYLSQDIVQRGDVFFSKIASENNLTDPFTKVLPHTPFER